MARPVSTQMTLDNHPLHVLTAGQGPPVVLLHSSSLGSIQWRRMLRRLSPSFRALAPDLLGNGPNPPWPAEQPFHFRQDLAVVMDLLRQLDGPLRLVGHSYGGLLALLAAAELGERVVSMALYEPVAVGALRARGIPLSLEEGDGLDAFFDLSQGLEPQMVRFIDYWNGQGAWAGLSEPRRQMFRACGLKMRHEVRGSILDAPPLSTLTTSSAPTLLLSGEHTPVDSARSTRVLGEEMTNARHVVIEGAGHMGPITHTRVFEEAVIAHLSEGL